MSAPAPFTTYGFKKQQEAQAPQMSGPGVSGQANVGFGQQTSWPAPYAGQNPTTGAMANPNPITPTVAPAPAPTAANNPQTGKPGPADSNAGYNTPANAAASQLASAQQAKAQNEGLVSDAQGFINNQKQIYPQTVWDERKRAAGASVRDHYQPMLDQIDQEVRNGASPLWASRQKQAINSKMNTDQINAIAAENTKLYQETEAGTLARAGLESGLSAQKPYQEMAYTNLEDYTRGAGYQSEEEQMAQKLMGAAGTMYGGGGGGGGARPAKPAAPDPAQGQPGQGGKPGVPPNSPGLGNGWWRRGPEAGAAAPTQSDQMAQLLAGYAGSPAQAAAVAQGIGNRMFPAGSEVAGAGEIGDVPPSASTATAGGGYGYYDPETGEWVEDDGLQLTANNASVSFD